MQLLLVMLCERWRGRSWATGADWGRGRDPGALTHSLSHSPSQDGLSLEFVAATAVRECNIQDARGGGLCWYRSGGVRALPGTALVESGSLKEIMRTPVGNHEETYRQEQTEIF